MGICAHTFYLVRKVQFDISSNKLKRFIGNTLNIKNKIYGNSYIFDALEIIKENVELIKNIMNHKGSSRQERIIIILIVIEVFDVFLSKMM